MSGSQRILEGGRMRDELTDSDFEQYELDEEDEECTCDIDGEDNCPVHYPICDECIARSRAFAEEMEKQHGWS